MQAPQQPNVPEVIDEIKDHKAGRWIGASEAMWRLYGFPLHDMGPSVVRLDVHEPDKQSVSFEERDDLRNVNLTKNTTLMAWFDLNRTDATARTYLYYEIPEHYRWDERNRSVWLFAFRV
jgi:hypothetical protein